MTRIIGPRGFVKFTVYDFAFTVAIGSIISSTLTSSTSLAHGSIDGLLLIMFLFSYLHRKSKSLSSAVSNAPLLFMDGHRILHENLKFECIQEEQVNAKLREANVLNYDQVFAVVLESTGDISVLHAANGDKNERFDKKILLGVRKKP